MPTSTARTTEIQPGFISIPVDLSSFRFPSEFTSNLKSSKLVYLLKEDFHVTLVGSGHDFVKKLAVAKKMTVSDAEAESMRAFERAADDMTFDVRLRPEYYMVIKDYEKPQPHRRHSIVLRCFVPQALEFYQRLYRLTNVHIGQVPHHVTLFSTEGRDARSGIGICHALEFLQLARPITEANVLKLLPKV